MIDKIIFKKHSDTAEGHQIILAKCALSRLHQKQKIQQKRQIDTETDSGRKHSPMMDLGHTQPPQLDPYR